jgi:hypothetical protein
MAQTAPKPAIVLPDPADASQWQKWAAELGWQLLAPEIDAKIDADTRSRQLAEAVHTAVKNGTVDPAHVYLAGRGEETALVFYIVSRVPDVWAAALALGGSPKPALNAGRLFRANFTDTPVLWVSDGAGDDELAARLKTAGLNIEWREGKGITIGQTFDELHKHTHSNFPVLADCETNTAKFGSCYWMEASKFDASERNDTLPSSRLLDGSGASLDLGAFGYKLTDPGPGVLISFLPKDYMGPLKTGDRLVELDGKQVADGRDFDARLNGIYNEKTVSVMFQRGKERIRLDTRVVLPRPDALVTARVQGRYDAADKSVRIVSRSVTELRVNLPQEWAPAQLYWNGLAIESLKQPGCYLLTVDKELLNAAPCSE